MTSWPASRFADDEAAERTRLAPVDVDRDAGEQDGPANESPMGTGDVSKVVGGRALRDLVADDARGFVGDGHRDEPHLEQPHGLARDAGAAPRSGRARAARRPPPPVSAMRASRGATRLLGLLGRILVETGVLDGDRRHPGEQDARCARPRR